MKQLQECTKRSGCDKSPIPSPCEYALEYYGEVLQGERPERRAPDCLQGLQLVTTGDGDPADVQAVPPLAASFAVMEPLRRRIADLRAAERTAQAAYAAFDSAYRGVRGRETPPLTLLRGAHVINDALAAAIDECRDELLTAQPGGGRPAAHLADALDRDIRLLARGVRQRTLYQHTVRSHGPTLAYVEQALAAGAEMRTLTEVFERLIVCDRAVAFIPVSEDRAAAALEIRHPAVVRFMVQAFERDWRRSVPLQNPGFSERPSIVVTDIQKSILRAVISGETDASIARRVGTSRRTVAEHIRKVSEALGSGSRAQLGYLVATSGILSDSEELTTASGGQARS